MDLLKPHLHKIRIPKNGDKIHKDECVYSFDTPDSATGLYVCLNTFLGFGRDFVELHHKKTGFAVFLHMRRVAHEVIANESDESKPKITKLAIGIEGGFNPDSALKKYTYEEMNSIVVLPQFVEIPLPNNNLPEEVLTAVSVMLTADAAFKLEEINALSGTWDGEKRKVSKFADNLIQLNNGVKIPPKGWKCQNCDMKDNLWLNLTDGSILCGRKFFDGSGGNNHAVEHYKAVGFPLAVKLGTITPEGADVYSYEEDEMVEDPHLSKHLSHFGINITNMEKTDKSMIELEIDLNQRLDEWSIIQEEGRELTPLTGPGYTGLVNLGNSCYMNSVLQVIFTIPDFQRLYFPPDEIFEASNSDPTGDITSQMAKLAYGLLSGKYSLNNDNLKEQIGIKPTMFKNLIGKGHTEFSTKRQQDAQEFFLHLINILERNNRGSHMPNASDCFKFQIEERIECVKSKKVKYNTRTEYILPLPIPVEKAVNLDAVCAYEIKKNEMEQKGEKMDPKDVVRPLISLVSCFDEFATPTIVDDFYSSALNAKSTAKQSSRIRTFPDYLMVQIKKFTLGDDWVPKKLDVALDVPEVINLEYLRGNGLQPNEELLPEPNLAGDLVQVSQPNVEFDMSILSQLCEMGFSIDACKRALYNTGNTGIETAMNWIMEHMSDADFCDPFTLDSGAASGATAKPDDFVADSDALTTIMSMGFAQHQAFLALKATNNNTERAVDWIFSHVEELENPMQVDTNPLPNTSEESVSGHFRDGSAKYKLIAFISHMGTSTMCGHYVCHIFKDGRWVIYNDNKVALSENPPKELAFTQKHDDGLLFQRYPEIKGLENVGL